MALVGGVEFPLVPPIVAGFQNMNATYRVREGDRGTINPTQASRPFSHDARGFVLAEGAGILVLAAEEIVQAHGLRPRAEVWGCAMTSDAYHHTKPHLPTIVRCIRLALEDAELAPEDIQHINCHGTSTRLGDQAEIEVLREAFERALPKIPITSTKSMLGHSLGATAAVEAILSIEGMHRDLMLPTVNHLRNGDLLRDDVDVVANEARQQPHEVVLNNAFGFGGTNCCVVLRKA